MKPAGWRNGRRSGLKIRWQRCRGGSSPFLPCQFTWQGGVGELLGELQFPEYSGVAQLVERR